MAGAEVVGSDLDAMSDALLAASRLLVALSVRSIAAAERTVTVSQFRSMVVLYTRGPLRLGSLAEQLGVNPSTTTRMIDRLAAVGLVTRQASPQSRRETVVTLTDSGTTVVREVMERRRADISGIVRQMPPKTRKGLIEALTAFTVAGGEPPLSSPAEEELWVE